MKTKTNYDYNDGQLVEVEVVRVKEYGALTVTTDGNKTQGLIHKSQIANAYIEDPNNYFEEEQVLEARIMDWDDNEQQMSLSTKEFNLKKQKKNNFKSISKLEKLRNKLKEKEKKTEEKPEENIKEDFEPNTSIDKEFDRIIKYLNGKIGVLSKKAKYKFANIINENGIFLFTRTLENTLKDFEIDYGVILAEQIKDNIQRDALVEYKISDHAVEKYKKRSKKYFDHEIDSELEKIKDSLKQMCYHGEVIIESENVKYIKYGNWFLPCSKANEEKLETWVVKSMLTWDMFTENMQDKADKYMTM
jgi:predicted RNA-binding protein with RPS1 domain